MGGLSGWPCPAVPAAQAITNRQAPLPACDAQPWPGRGKRRTCENHSPKSPSFLAVSPSLVSFFFSFLPSPCGTHQAGPPRRSLIAGAAPTACSPCGWRCAGVQKQGRGFGAAPATGSIQAQYHLLGLVRLGLLGLLLLLGLAALRRRRPIAHRQRRHLLLRRRHRRRCCCHRCCCCRWGATCRPGAASGSADLQCRWTERRQWGMSGHAIDYHAVSMQRQARER